MNTVNGVLPWLVGNRLGTAVTPVVRGLTERPSCTSTTYVHRGLGPVSVLFDLGFRLCEPHRFRLVDSVSLTVEILSCLGPAFLPPLL